MTPDGPVLIVEDDPQFRDLLALQLEEAGFATVGAQNGAVALEYLRSNPLPCLILLDLMMPQMSGGQFTAEQRRSRSLSQVPVIVLTGADRPKDVDVALRPTAWLVKPYDLPLVVPSVRKHCRKAEGDSAGSLE